MGVLSWRREDSILAVLIVLTIVSFSVVESVSVEWRQLTAYGVVFVAAFKARLIVLDFMEVRDAPPKWRLMYQTWYISISIMLLIGQYTASSHMVS